MTSARHSRKAAPDTVLDQHLAKERIRQIQQGLGRPIIAAKIDDDTQIVAVGSTIHWSKK